jgi:tRNA threonylcarbamoyl adenosine modification protein YeaZ
VKILALELSSAAASLAVAEDGRLTDVRRFEAPRGRGAEVFALLDQMRASWTGLDRLAVGLGPGSYNGLRVACALAGSFQLALGIKLVTAPSCCLLDVVDPHYIAAGDARGDRIWWAEVRERRLTIDIALLPHTEFRQRAETAPLPLYRVGPIRDFERLPSATPDAAVLAALADHLEPIDPACLEPLYLKPPHITMPRAARP